MATILDRLGRELEEFGRRAQSALDEGRLQIELLRVRRRRDRAARDLGLLVHRRERGGESEQERYSALLERLDRMGEEITRLERQIAAERAETVSVATRPAPPTPETEAGDAEPAAQ